MARFFKVPDLDEPWGMWEGEGGGLRSRGGMEWVYLLDARVQKMQCEDFSLCSKWECVISTVPFSDWFKGSLLSTSGKLFPFKRVTLVGFMLVGFSVPTSPCLWFSLHIVEVRASFASGVCV